MLEKLTLRSFQAHKKLTIEFDPRVTVVVGDSDAGKSAIIRALAWVMLNRPNGDAFIRHGDKCAIVTLEVDGQVIVRSRGSGENAYNLNSDEFKAFGNAVPERVAELLKVGDINFQLQHEAPFWFCETAGEVSRRLNHVINLGVIDDVLGDVVSQVRKARASVEFIEERCKKAKETRDALLPVVAANEAFELVEAAEQKHLRVAERAASLAALIEGLTAYRAKADKARQAANRGASLVLLAKAALDARTARTWLSSLIGEASQHRKAARVKLPDLTPLNKLRADHGAVVSRRAELEAAIERLRSLWKAQKTASLEAKAAHDEFHARTKDESCPLCGAHHK